MEYELHLAFEGLQATYFLIIPTHGVWWDEKKGSKWGPSPKVEKCTIKNVAAAFDISGYRPCDAFTRNRRGGSASVSRDGLPLSTVDASQSAEAPTMDPRSLNQDSAAAWDLPSSSPSVSSSPQDPGTLLDSQLSILPRKAIRARTTACLRCRKDKQGCKDKQPGRVCRRCVRLGHDCLDG